MAQAGHDSGYEVFPRICNLLSQYLFQIWLYFNGNFAVYAELWCVDTTCDFVYFLFSTVTFTVILCFWALSILLALYLSEKKQWNIQNSLNQACNSKINCSAMWCWRPSVKWLLGTSFFTNTLWVNVTPSFWTNHLWAEQHSQCRRDQFLFFRKEAVLH